MNSEQIIEENYLVDIIKKYSGKYTPKDLINKIKIDLVRDKKGHTRLIEIDEIIDSMINTGKIELRVSNDIFRSKVCWLME